MNIKKFLNKNIGVIIVFLLTFAFFYFVQFSSDFLAGNDSHLYIKLASIVREQGLVKEFPWLNSTIMKDSFTGLHFLYYVMLIPFTFFGDLIFGAKIASLFFLSLMASVFFITLKSLKLKFNFLWYLLLLSSSGYFLLRMNFTRPLNFSVIFILLILYSLIKNNNLMLFLVSFFYVWAHASFPLTIFIVLLFVFINYIYTKKIRYKTVLCFFSGMILALFINPFFPNNINYFNIYYSTSIPYSLTIEISEWQPLHLSQIFQDAPMLVTVFIILISVYLFSFALKLKNIRNENIENENKIIISFLFLSSIILFIMTLIMGRFIDYWIPFCVLFIAFYSEFLYFSVLKKIDIDKLLKKIKIYKFLSWEEAKLTIAIVLVLILSLSALNKMSFVIQRSSNEKLNKDIKEAAYWLKENTPKNSIVFNVNWGDFSKLFFYNSDNYYIMGLDSKFIYLVSPEKYWLYSNIKEGVVCEKEECSEKQDNRSVYDIIRKEFNAEYVFISTKDEYFDYTNLINIFNEDSRFEIVYQNDSRQIWDLN